MPGIALVQETFRLNYNFGELSIPLFTTSCPIQHVCHCHQWHIPDNLSCLRISQVLTLINKTATLWVIGALSLCALYALWYFERNIFSRYICTNLPRNSWNMAVINHWNVEGALQSPICITQLWKCQNCRECCFTDILWSYACLLISFSDIQFGSEFSSRYIMTYCILIWERHYIFPCFLILLSQIKYSS